VLSSSSSLNTFSRSYHRRLNCCRLCSPHTGRLHEVHSQDAFLFRYRVDTDSIVDACLALG